MSVRLGPSDLDVAAALAGDAEALSRLAAEDEDGELARRHRVSSALYLRCAELGVDGPALAAWRRSMIALSARHLVFDESLRDIAAALAAAGVGWVPLKGCDLARRVYEHAEERSTSDLDLLIAAGDLERARQALSADGWAGVDSGPRARRYLDEEGYAWQATRHDVLLELHFRLWGSVPSGLAAAVIAAAEPHPDLPAGGRFLPLRHAYLVAAVHAWLVPRPRGVGLWRDLERIAAAAPPGLAAEVVASARRWDLQLPVLLASEVAAGLWPAETCRRVARDLSKDLRPAERLMLARARRRDPAQVSLAGLSAARLVAGRRSRHRLRALWRRLWPHPGVVEGATDPAWGWPARRLWYQSAHLGWRRAARRIESLNTSGEPPAERRAEP